MFLQRLEDSDHNVRKEAVQLLTAAALTRPALTAPCITATLPLLLQLTVVDESLVRVVELGPFKQKVDDGLSLRKHTLECVEVRHCHYSHLRLCCTGSVGFGLSERWWLDGELLERVVHVQTLLSRPAYQDKLDMGAIATAVARSLGDDKAIKPVAHTLVCRLCALAPAAVLAQLEGMIPPLQKTLNEKLKDDAIPQEVCRDHGHPVLFWHRACAHGSIHSGIK